MRHYLSWIEGLTTNQYVEGSNPPWRTSKPQAARHTSGGLFVYAGSPSPSSKSSSQL